MFRNKPLHELPQSHNFDVSPNWREVQEKCRQLPDSHLFRFHEDLVPREPAWLIHEDQDVFNSEEARKMAPEFFKGGMTGKTIDSLQSMFEDLEVAACHLDVFHSKFATLLA